VGVVHRAGPGDELHQRDEQSRSCEHPRQNGSAARPRTSHPQESEHRHAQRSDCEQKDQAAVKVAHRCERRVEGGEEDRDRSEIGASYPVCRQQPDE
jgi:hypothetical protein